MDLLSGTIQVCTISRVECSVLEDESFYMQCFAFNQTLQDIQKEKEEKKELPREKVVNRTRPRNYQL